MMGYMYRLCCIKRWKWAIDGATLTSHSVYDTDTLCLVCDPNDVFYVRLRQVRCAGWRHVDALGDDPPGGALGLD